MTLLYTWLWHILFLQHLQSAYKPIFFMLKCCNRRCIHGLSSSQICMFFSLSCFSRTEFYDRNQLVHLPIVLAIYPYDRIFRAVNKLMQIKSLQNISCSHFISSFFVFFFTSYNMYWTCTLSGHPKSLFLYFCVSETWNELLLFWFYCYLHFLCVNSFASSFLPPHLKAKLFLFKKLLYYVCNYKIVGGFGLFLIL